MGGGDEVGSSSTAISSSNIGFQILKKCGWTEGTGLGVAEQGRLAPVQVHVKNNKSGLGAEQVKRKVIQLPKDHAPKEKSDTENLQSRKKAKTASKRIRKMLEEEKAYQEKEFERAFFREFWPDNV